MDKLKELSPRQIMAVAIVMLIVILAGGSFAVLQLTAPKPVPASESAIPADLNSESNQKIVESLEDFERPAALPAQGPLRTPDPQNPSTVNPFTR